MRCFSQRSEGKYGCSDEARGAEPHARCCTLVHFILIIIFHSAFFARVNKTIFFRFSGAQEGRGVNCVLFKAYLFITNKNINVVFVHV